MFDRLEDLAPYGGQTSSSCGGLVAFGHQMGALWAPWHVKLKLEALCVPPSCDPKKSQEKDSNIMNVWT